MGIHFGCLTFSSVRTRMCTLIAGPVGMHVHASMVPLDLHWT